MKPGAPWKRLSPRYTWLTCLRGNLSNSLLTAPLCSQCAYVSVQSSQQYGVYISYQFYKLVLHVLLAVEWTSPSLMIGSFVAMAAMSLGSYDREMSSRMFQDIPQIVEISSGFFMQSRCTQMHGRGLIVAAYITRLFRIHSTTEVFGAIDPEPEVRALGVSTILQKRAGTVIAACRDPSSAADLHTLKGVEGNKDRLDLVQMDIKDQASVESAAEHTKTKHGVRIFLRGKGEHEHVQAGIQTCGCPSLCALASCDNFILYVLHRLKRCSHHMAGILVRRRLCSLTMYAYALSCALYVGSPIRVWC